MIDTTQKPTDKLKKILDNMRKYGIGTWLIQETWQEIENVDEEVNGFHIFNNNYYIEGR